MQKHEAPLDDVACIHVMSDQVLARAGYKRAGDLSWPMTVEDQARRIAVQRSITFLRKNGVRACTTINGPNWKVMHVDQMIDLLVTIVKIAEETDRSILDTTKDAYRMMARAYGEEQQRRHFQGQVYTSPVT